MGQLAERWVEISNSLKRTLKELEGPPGEKTTRGKTEQNKEITSQLQSKVKAEGEDKESKSARRRGSERDNS